MTATKPPDTRRRALFKASAGLGLAPFVVSPIAGCYSDPSSSTTGDAGVALSGTETVMKIHYLEMVTPDVDALCAQYASAHGVTFGEPDAALGGARTARLGDGGMLGIRAPLRPDETPAVRPYILVDDIDAAVVAAAEAGAMVAIPSMALPGHGTIAIVIHGGIESGFWQV